MIYLCWIPLGAGGHFVHWNGRLFEALVARRQHRAPLDLYHSALEVVSDDARFVIEMTPAWGHLTPGRGVVCEGAVGARLFGRSKYFRYEVRCWRDGVIPDAGAMVDGPRCVSADESLARRLLELVPQFPTAVWGRDKLGTGEMWNSNSLTAWLLASSGLDMTRIVPPEHGRAPGWTAGIVMAGRPAAVATG